MKYKLFESVYNELTESFENKHQIFSSNDEKEVKEAKSFYEQNSMRNYSIFKYEIETD